MNKKSDSYLIISLNKLPNFDLSYKFLKAIYGKDYDSFSISFSIGQSIDLLLQSEKFIFERDSTGYVIYSKQYPNNDDIYASVYFNDYNGLWNLTEERCFWIATIMCDMKLSEYIEQLEKPKKPKPMTLPPFSDIEANQAIKEFEEDEKKGVV